MVGSIAEDEESAPLLASGHQIEVTAHHTCRLAGLNSQNTTVSLQFENSSSVLEAIGRKLHFLSGDNRRNMLRKDQITCKRQVKEKKCKK